ncbi:ATP-binding protein, partial [Ruminococcus sp.]
MRYAFLERTAEREGCALIATGHHQRDNAET